MLRRHASARLQLLEAHSLKPSCLAHPVVLYSYNNKVVVCHIGFPNRVEADLHAKTILFTTPPPAPLPSFHLLVLVFKVSLRNIKYICY